MSDANEPKAQHEARMAELLEDFRTAENDDVATFHELHEYADELHEQLEGEREKVAELKGKNARLDRSNDKYAEDLRLNLDSLWRALQAKEAAERVVERIKAFSLCPFCGEQDGAHAANCTIVDYDRAATHDGARKEPKP